MRTPHRTFVIAIAAIIAIPIVFGAIGGGQAAGLALGVVLVVAGLAWSALGAARGRRSPDED
jgi:hypothetical protein